MSTKRNKGRSRRGGRGLGGALQPPPFVPTLSLSHRFRFTNTGNSGTFDVTRAQLLNLLLYTPTASTSVRLFQAVRLKKVDIWANPPALGAAPTSVQIEWFGENSPTTIVSDTTMGVRPAHVSSTPPSSSSNRWWSVSGFSETDKLFQLTLPADCVVDVTAELRLVDNEAPTAGDVPSGATVGQLYGDYLDGLASGKLVPIGYVTLP